MAKYGLPAKTEVVWATSGGVSSYTAVTAAECNAATDITAFLRAVPNIIYTGNVGDASDLSSAFNKQQATTYGGDAATLEVYRDDSSDTAHDAFTNPASGSFTSGFLIVARQGLATYGTFATSDIVDVYPATVTSRSPGVPGRDELDFDVVTLAITDEPSEDQTI